MGFRLKSALQTNFQTSIIPILQYSLTPLLPYLFTLTSSSQLSHPQYLFNGGDSFFDFHKSIVGQRFHATF